MKGELNKKIGFSLLPLALFFLFEPFVNILDILPDFIGYIIVCFALINLADINDRIKDAFVGFRKAAIINFFRIPVIYLLERFFVDNEQTVSLLMFTFVFSVLELLALLPAFKNFFDGLLGLGLTHDGAYVCHSRRPRGRTTTEKTYTLTVWFVLIKYLASALPEFTTLISNDAYEFIKLLRIIGIIVAAILGTVWLVLTLRYLSNVKKDAPFIERLSEKYLNFSSENQGFYIARGIKIALFALMLASAFSADFYSSYVNLIPDAAFYIFILLSAIALKKHSRKWIALVALCSFGVGTSIVSSMLANSFYSEFNPRDVLKSVKAYDSFYTMLGVHIADAIIFLITVSVLILLVWDIYRKHTDMARDIGSRAIKAQKAGFLKSTLLPAISALLATVATPYYIASQPFYYIGKWYVEYAAMISVAFSIIFSVSMCYYLNSIINSVKSYYGVID